MEDKEWSDWDQHKSFFRSLTIMPWIFWLLLIVLTVFATKAFAVPVAETTENEARIVLYDDPCVVKEVTNLKKRATWQEKGKHYEGCYAVHPYGLIVAYFSDGAVVIIPVDVFRKVTGA